MSGLFLILLILGIFYLIYAGLRQASQLKYIQDFRFHPALKQKLKNKHPALTDAQMDLVFQGLRDYFYICNKAGRRMVSMPSQVVDDAWHEFILFTRSYQLFCQKALGRFLHHTPAEAMRTPTLAQDGIKRAWRLACRKEHINPKTPLRLPLLFAIDAQLAITGSTVAPYRITDSALATSVVEAVAEVVDAAVEMADVAGAVAATRILACENTAKRKGTRCAPYCSA